jgi:hypothetical protein
VSFGVHCALATQFLYQSRLDNLKITADGLGHVVNGQGGHGGSHERFHFHARIMLDAAFAKHNGTSDIGTNWNHLIVVAGPENVHCYLIQGYRVMNGLSAGRDMGKNVGCELGVVTLRSF